MASPEHLKILKEGVEVWNVWRKDHTVVADLTGAKLGGAALKGANLNGTDLEFADLNGANLHAADLHGANLHAADLHGANLQRADLGFATLNDATLNSANLIVTDLNGANLTGANLRDANLNGADLTSANLRVANLTGANLAFANLTDADLILANLSGADFGWTVIGNVDLSLIQGLTKVRHKGPSEIATSTLERTAVALAKDASRRGEVEAFLRGAGVPESIMAAFALMSANPNKFCSCFISYSHTDSAFAHRLYDQVQARGIRCWLDDHDLKPGDRILDVVDDAIRLHDKILLCCSNASLESWWVKDEIRKAQARERNEDRLIIIPLNLDGYLFEWEDGLAEDIRTRLAADFTGWEHDNARFEREFERVVQALRTDKRAQERAAKPTVVESD